MVNNNFLKSIQFCIKSDAILQLFFNIDKTEFINIIIDENDDMVKILINKKLF